MSKEKTTLLHKVLTVVGTVMCVILIPILIINSILIIKSFTEPDEVPSLSGVLPLIVMTDSMYPQIQSGDLIICHTLEPDEVEEGDVIAFFDPAGNGVSIVTHRVLEVVSDGEGLAFRTKGDANNTEDRELVPADNLVAEYKFRIPGMGSVAMFMQTTWGLVICVVLPLLLLIGYDVIRTRKYQKKKQEDTDALLAELAALKAEKAAREDISKKQNSN